jgi:putative endopeptidase
MKSHRDASDLVAITTMRQIFFVALILLSLYRSDLAVSQTARPNVPAVTPASVQRPIDRLPYAPSLDLSAMDRSANACVDFYRYACGGWVAHNPIPSDQASWSVYAKLYAQNQQFLWGILEQLGDTTVHRTANQQKIGDYYAACIDENAAERLNAAPLAPTLARIEALHNVDDLPGLLAQLHLETGVGGFLFQFESDQDFADSSQVIAFAKAGGLGMPDRDYYTEQDSRAVELRRLYSEHVARTFVLLGDSPDAAQAHAATVLSLETALAKNSLTRVELRDPHKSFHKMDRAALGELTPHFDWTRYLTTLGLADITILNVTEPKFYAALDQLLAVTPVADLKVYLRWHAAHVAAPYLTHAFEAERFEFFDHTLRGVPAEKPRWKRCVRQVDVMLGEALGQEFVARTFGPQLKDETLKMTRQIEHAMREDIEGLAWMSDATKRQALAKLDAIVNKIGYPDHWRDYSSVRIDRRDYYGNAQRAIEFETKRELAKIGKPLDRSECHELTHGFDDEGRQFDAAGNLKDWWTDADAKQFNERTQCIVDQYAKYVVVDDVHINSRLTIGEDAADLGGLILAHMAWRAQTAGEALQPKDGLTPEQRFFVGYAQWACESDRPENLRVHAKTDPHSPGRYRVNGLVVNMREFAEAFSCPVTAPLVKKDVCRVW